MTRKGPFSRVISHVNGDGVGLSETLRAHRTLVRFFFSVGANVMAQNFPVGKALATVLALVRFNSLVHFSVRSDVFFQNFLAADFAHAPTFPVVQLLDIVTFHVLDVAAFVGHHFFTNRALKVESVV